MSKVIISTKPNGEISVTLKTELLIDVYIPISQTIAAARWDKVNKKERKTMEDLCADVANILKNEFGFKIFREEDRTRRGPDGNFVVTEGHPSPNKDSLSLYYYVRYDIVQSDSFARDNYRFNNVKAVVDCDLVIRVTDHPFNQSGLVDTINHDRKVLNQFADELGTRADYRDVERRDIRITDTITRDYNKGLDEIRHNVKEAIIEWRASIYNAVRSKY